MVARFLRQKTTNRYAYVSVLVLLLVTAAPVFVLQGSVHASELLKRSVRVTSSVPGAETDHIYNFEVATSGILGSIAFEYCSNSPLFSEPCVPPVDISFAGTTLDNQSGETGFSISGISTANKLILSRPPSASVAQLVGYNFANVINPSTASQSIYIRISTYASDDATGSRIDTGAVVYSTSGGIGVGGFVPPYLTFCVGLNVSDDCSSASGNSIDLGFLSKSSTSTASSQFAGATNDLTGYTVFLTGTTMTSGNNIISALSTPSASQIGSSQFGVNARANTSPAVGQNMVGSGTATVSPDYNINNRFVFRSGDVIASSPLTTEFNRVIVSYVVNVSRSQPPGVYVATFTYIATASF